MFAFFRGIRFLIQFLYDNGRPVAGCRVFFKVLAAVTVLCLSVSPKASAQGDCTNPILLTNLDNWCSAPAAYITYPAASGYGTPTCWGAVNRETWFTFTAVANYVNVRVYGATYGGDLQRPEIALYSGNCGGTLNQMACVWAANGVHYAEIFRGGLTVGETYLIRVDGINNPQKNFQLCINNFATPPLPGQDCNTASYLCTQDAISIQFSPGGGADDDEASNTCLDGYNDPFLEPSETNSIWLKWECGTSGTLTFDIHPTQEISDLDWCLYELPNGVNDCSGKVWLRCNSSACEGSTGINLTSTDIVEDPDCDFGEDLYCRYIDMVAGRAYALVVNNFTSGQDGFVLEWGGTGGFKNLRADFDYVQTCGSDVVTFTDNSSNAVAWEWTFGAGATPSSASTAGPHNVTYAPGNHTAILTITDADGCTDFEYVNFSIPWTVDYTTSITDVSCGGPNDGAITVNVSSGSGPYQFSIDGGSTFSAPQASGTFTWNSLAAGNYGIVVLDSNGCQNSSMETVGSAGGLSIDNITAVAEDCDAANGSITATITGSDPPYQYSSDGGATWSAGTAMTTFTFNNLPDGTYTISVMDNSGCSASQAGVMVGEQNQLFYTGVPSQPASCDDDDGSITANINGTVGPYSYSNDNGMTFSAPQPGTSYTFTGLSAGTYNLIVTDANGCSAAALASVGSPPPVQIDNADSVNANCTASDGSVSVTISGGTAPFQFSIDGGTTYSAPQAGTSFSFSGLTGGTYTLAILDDNNCTATREVTVGVNDLSSDDTFNASICPGDSTLFGGSYYSAAGTYTETLTNVYGCDSIVHLDLTVLPYAAGSDMVSICTGMTYTLPSGTVVSTGGVYTDTIPGFTCDSIITIDVQELPLSFASIDVDICPGESYVMPLGEIITQPGVYQDTIFRALCDSIITVTVNQLPLAQSSVSASICSGGTYTLPLGGVVSDAGTYVDTLPGFRCDSVVTVTLSVDGYSTGTAGAAICPGDSYLLPGGEIVVQPGVYTDTIAGADCDSIVTVTVQLLPYAAGSASAAICPGEDYMLPSGTPVNAPGTYLDTIAGAGCDSVVTIDIQQLPYASGSASASICPGATYILPSGAPVTAAGTYLDTIAGFRCDSIVTVDIQELPFVTGTVDAAICPGEIYFLPNGTMTITPGIYIDTLMGAACDSIVTTTLQVLPYAAGSASVSICPGDSYTLPGGTVVNTAGTYVDTIAESRCDSIVTVTVSQLSDVQENISETICPGDSATIDGLTYYDSDGTYSVTLQGSSCDSVVTLILTVDEPPSTSSSLTLCPGDSATLNGTDYYSEPGTYSDTISTDGCDSIISLSLQFLPYAQGSAAMEICEGDSATINGLDYFTASGQYLDTIPGVYCDSVVTLDLVVRPQASAMLTLGICTGDSATINGSDYYASTGIYTEVLAGFYCDSTVTMDLTVSDNSLTVLTESICAGDSATISGMEYYYASGTYSDTLPGARCDSVVRLDLTVIQNSMIHLDRTICLGDSVTISGTVYYSASGSYTEILAGSACDSIVTLNLTVIDFTLTGTAITDANCNGDGGQVILSTSGGTNPIQYEVTGNGNTVSGTSGVIGLDPGSYNASISDNNGCTLTTGFTIGQEPAPEFSVSPDFASIIEGESVDFTVLPSTGDYSWSPPEYLTCDTCTLVRSTPPHTITYIITYLENGCVATKSVTVEVKQPEVLMPSAFTPNGDGINDVLFVFDTYVEELIYFRVFNRWGELLFETDDILDAWDGTFQNDEQEMDTYLYHIRVIMHSGREVELKGPVMLIR